MDSILRIPSLLPFTPVASGGLQPPTASAGPLPAGVPVTVAGLTVPQLSLTGNVVGLGVNVLIAWWAWKRGGWWKLLAVTNAASALYFIGKIESQV